jgi:hypothetical protein
LRCLGGSDFYTSLASYPPIENEISRLEQLLAAQDIQASAADNGPASPSLADDEDFMDIDDDDAGAGAGSPSAPVLRSAFDGVPCGNPLLLPRALPVAAGGAAGAVGDSRENAVVISSDSESGDDIELIYDDDVEYVFNARGAPVGVFDEYNRTLMRWNARIACGINSYNLPYDEKEWGFFKKYRNSRRNRKYIFDYINTLERA